MIIQVTDGNGNSTVQTVQNGISHAVDYYRNNPAKRVVVNLSLSFPDASQALLDAIDYANMYNVLVVASAGNNGWTPVNFPAGYSGIYSNVIAVGASDHQDNHSSFASQGPELNVVAPGGFGGYQDGSVFRYNGTQNLGRNIFSTTPDYPFNLQSETDLEPLYTYSAGVSMAVPHVSGTTALLLSLNPSLSPSDIRTILEATAEKVGGSAYDANGWNQEMGYGRINAYKALKLTLEQHGGTLTNNLTIPAGEVWNFSPGVIVRFAPGTGITVLGTLNAVGTPTSPVLFTSASGSTPGSWGSIVFDGSGASGSTLQYATIQYNTEIHAVNTSNITIQNCSVLETDQGIRFTTATGSVLNTSLTSSTVYHGIVAENGSTITCNENILNKVSPNLRTGAAILYVGSGGNLWKNDVYGWDWGVGTIWGSSPHFYNQSNNNKNNRIRNCNYGVMVYRQSYPVICPDLAENFPPYMGNSIYSNTKQVSLNADNNTTSALPAQLTWWGGEPTPSMFVTGTGSSVDYDNWLDTDPWEGSGFVSGGDGESVATTRATVEQSPRASQEDGISLHDGIALRQQGKLREATDFFLTYLAGHPDHQAAYVELYNCYNEEMATDLINYFSSLPAQAAKEHALLLGNLHLKSGNPKLATKINEKLINENPNSALSSRAKLNNAYIALYNEKDIDRALVLYNDAATKPELSTEIELTLARRAIGVYPGAQARTNQVLQSRPEREETTPGVVSVQNYPNPFNPSTEIRYQISEISHVTLKVYDVLGREVATLVNGEREAGTHRVRWDAAGLPSGVYLYRLKANSFVETRKMALVR